MHLTYITLIFTLLLFLEILCIFKDFKRNSVYFKSTSSSSYYFLPLMITKAGKEGRVKIIKISVES